MKGDRSVRLCGDYKVTINPVIHQQEYPLPHPDELLAQLNGGQKFSKLDLSNAYLQIVLDPESRKYVTINTHLGLFQYTGLPFGVSSSPAIFQKCMDQVLSGLNGVGCYLDDIIVTGKNDEEHLRNLEQVIKKLDNFGLKLKESKCSFFQDSIQYLGWVVDANGVHASTTGVEAILNASEPKNIQELQSLIGMINNYRKFMPNLSSILTPMTSALKFGKDFHWTSDCQKAFEEIKQILISPQVLAYFDPSKEITLAVHASPTGIGAVISHTTQEGEKTIAYASRRLTKAEQNYSQKKRKRL